MKTKVGTRTKPSKPKPQGIRITFVRHGQAGGTPGPGDREAPLTPLGKCQARRVAQRLAGERFDHAYSSDLSRATQTAREILRHHPRTPLTVTSAIREVAIHHMRRGRTPRRKGLQERLRRERAAVERFCRRLVRNHHPGERVLVVAHGTVIGLIITLLAGANPKRSLPLDMRNSSVSVVTLRRGRFDIWNTRVRVDLCNCIRHLPPSQVS